MDSIEKFRKGLNKVLKGANEIMDTFIEITERFDGLKICLPIREIKSVSTDKSGNTFIETGKDLNGEPVGIYCSDDYSKIMLKLFRFILQGE